MVEMRRRAAGQASRPTAGEEEGPQEDAPPEVTRILADLFRDGNLTLEDDDGDAEYVDIEEMQEEGDIDNEEYDEDIDMEEDEDEDDIQGLFGYQITQGHALTSRARWHEEVKEPKQGGLDLLFSGEFGRIQHQMRSRNKAGNVAKLLLNRGSQVRPIHKEDFATVSDPVV